MTILRATKPVLITLIVGSVFYGPFNIAVIINKNASFTVTRIQCLAIIVLGYNIDYQRAM